MPVSFLCQTVLYHSCVRLFWLLKETYVGYVSAHRFPGPSSKLCKWLRHQRGTLHLRAAVHRRCQRVLKRVVLITLWKQHDVKHAGKDVARLPRVAKGVPFDSNDFSFITEGYRNSISAGV